MIHDPYLDDSRQERGCLNAVTLAVGLVLSCLLMIAGAAIIYAVHLTAL